jgi:sulfhydrogenase subunit beta (sulfur reductase)
VTIPARTIHQLKAPEGLDSLIRDLGARGYEVIGPTVRDKTIVLARIESSADLPRGVRDEQEKGTYRLKKSDDDGFFGYNLGPTSWKSYLFPERRRLWQLKRNGNPEASPATLKPFAFFGVRACELAAIAVQDRAFLRDSGDPEYRARRERLFVVGVHCRTAAPTCFCPSMGTGPEFAATGWDLLLTEDKGRFFLEAATDKGQAILSVLPLETAPKDERQVITDQLAATTKDISRQLDQQGIKEQIYNSLTSSRWDDIGSRCLSCANCTLVCPTCFCSTVEDVSDVENATAERWQKWDSCFHIDFSYVHGGSRRVTTASRYRQWFTHKLATWYDQFGTSGCVGCGRCIAWCPVGIDITEEMAAIRNDAAKKDEEKHK